jgi:8-oxo-dGTP pyrophosphatase MutT (NUDIX family)/phosphohistidine phosphatase SixA
MDRMGPTSRQTPTAVATTPVLAAGAVVWRVIDGKTKVLLVHRTQHKDVSLPKGKVDQGETLPETAAREILEETGLEVILGAPLGVVEYTLPNGRDKIVHYWSAEVNDHLLELAKFTPNDEIAALEWLPIGKAAKKLSYAHDREVVDRLRERLKAKTARTFAIIAVRHGKAVPPGTWDGPDSSRPLMHRGTDQAAQIAGGLAAYAPERIISSPAARCLATVAPVSQLTGLPIRQEAGISQDAYQAGQDTVGQVVRKSLKRHQSAVLCSHGPVIPDLIAEVALQLEAQPDSTLRRAGNLGTGDFAVLHVSHRKGKPAQLVAVEVHEAPGD